MLDTLNVITNILTGCTSLFASITSPNQPYFSDTSTHSQDNMLIYAVPNMQSCINFYNYHDINYIFAYHDNHEIIYVMVYRIS